MPTATYAEASRQAIAPEKLAAAMNAVKEMLAGLNVAR
jgi:hypothetical protein